MIFDLSPIIPPVKSRTRSGLLRDAGPRLATPGDDGIENFWNQAKRHMRKFNGVPKKHFHLFLKECEWRFNGGSPKQLLRQLRLWIKMANQR